MSTVQHTKLLFIGKNPIQLKRIQAILTKYSIITARDIDEAIVCLKAEAPPNLALIDLTDKDGDKSLVSLKRFCKDIPVVVIVDYNNKKSTEKFLKSGAMDFLEASFSETELLIRIKNVLETQSLKKRLTKSKEKYRYFLENLRDIAFETDLNGNVIFASKSAEEATGLPLKDIINKPFLPLFTRESQKVAMDVYQRTLFHGESLICELTFNNGRIFQYKQECMVDDAEKVTGIFGIARDITETKRMENQLIEYKNNLEKQVKERTRHLEAAKIKAETANKAKTNFIASISHELRTPLNGILGFVDLLRMQGHNNKLSTEKQSLYLQRIKDSGIHLLSLINDILDITRIESGKVELYLENHNLNDLLERLFLLFKEQTSAKNIRFNIKLREIIKISADETKLKQIIFNILSNAVKFTPVGGKITVKAEKIENHSVLISVCDTGIGIKHNDREKVFRKFEQGKSGYTQTEGAGLGMALTKKLVELHDGKIWFESKGKNKGTCFFVQLPLNSARS